ncbi:MAG: (d)CMP kinase [Fimbriimonadaceae bacterium]
MAAKRGVVIAIDGPAGAGKSTVAKALARALELRYLDTGAMYRALALKAKRIGLGPLDGDDVAALGPATRIDFEPGDPQRVLLDGEDVTEAIRATPIGQLASELSTHAGVRKVLVQRQQEVVSQGGIILEGRDVTTVVAPDADVKVYLTASLEERAGRRLREFASKGMETDFSRVRHDMEERDHRDITRVDSPLSVAHDAHIIDSAHMTAEEVVAAIQALL